MADSTICLIMPLNVKNFFLCIFALSAGLSSFQLVSRTIDHRLHPAAHPLHSLSQQFVGLKKPFIGVARAGYYTDKNLDLPLVIAQFEQAQYILAPTVLEINTTGLPLVIFDCTSPQVAIAKIKELGLVPISASNTGLILAINPKTSENLSFPRASAKQPPKGVNGNPEKSP